MVGAGRERGLMSSIPDAPLRRALLDSMATPPGPSSSTAVPSRGRGREGRREELEHVVAGEEVG